MKQANMNFVEVHELFEDIRNNPYNGDVVSPIYADIRVKTVNFNDVEKHILYAIDSKNKIVCLIEASQYDLRTEKRIFLYSLSALYELRLSRKAIFKIITKLLA